MDNANIEQLFAKLMETLMSPAGMGSFGPLMAKMLQSMPGMHGSDVLWKIIPFSQQGSMGAYLQMQQSLSQGVIQNALGSVNDSARQQWMVDLAKTMTSKASFNAMPEKDRLGMNYEQYIQHKAMGMWSNPFFSMAYKWADPSGTIAFNKGLEQSYSNIVKRNPFGVLGSRAVYGAASDMITGLFTDENGNFDFKSEDYAGFGKGAIGTLVNEITKTTDVLAGVDVNNPTQVKNATVRLRDRIKEYADALEPLKDVFGEDMSKMLSTIESITGSSISRTSSTQLETLNNRIISGMMTGTLDLGQVDATQKYYRSAMSQLGLRPTEEVWAGQQAVEANLLTNGPAQYGFLSKGFQKKFTDAQVFNASNSPMADSLAKAYSIWEQNVIRANQGRDVKDREATDFSTFRQKVEEAMTGNGGNMAKAMIDVAGVSNKYQLEEGTAYGGYRRVKETQEAANMVEGRVSDRHMTRAAIALGRDATMREALGRTMGAGWKTKSNAEMAAEVRRVETLIAANPELLNMDNATRQATIQQMIKDQTVTYTVNGQEQQLDMNTVMEGNAAGINAVMERLKNTQPDVVMYMRNRYNREQSIIAEREMRDVRATAKKLMGETLPDAVGIKGLANRIVEWHGETGIIKDKLRDLAQGGFDLTKQGQRQGLALAEGLILQGNEEYGRLTGENLGKMTADQKKALDERLIANVAEAKSLTAGSLTDAQRSELMQSEDWKKYKDKADQEIRGRMASTLNFYMTDPRANTKLMREERKAMGELIDKDGTVVAGGEELLKRSAARMQVLKDTNADRIQQYLDTAEISEEGNSLRATILKSGGDIKKLTEAQQTEARKLGYGEDAARNLRQAKLDRLAEIKAQGKSVGNTITKELIAGKIKGTGTDQSPDVQELFNAYYRYADNAGEGYSADSLQRYMESKEYKAFRGATFDTQQVASIEAQAKNIMSAASSGTKGAGSMSDVLGLMNMILQNLREINKNTDKEKDTSSNSTDPSPKGKGKR